MNCRSRSEPAPSCRARCNSFCAIEMVAGDKGWLPKLVKVRHGDTPMRHGTAVIQFGYLLKCVFGGGVGEGVKESHAFIELGLSRRCARDGERYFPQLLRRRVAMCLLRRREGDDKQKRERYSP